MAKGKALRIRMNTAISGVDFSAAAGQEVEVEEDLALNLCGTGQAVPVGWKFDGEYPIKAKAEAERAVIEANNAKAGVEKPEPKGDEVADEPAVETPSEPEKPSDDEPAGEGEVGEIADPKKVAGKADKPKG